MHEDQDYSYGLYSCYSDGVRVQDLITERATVQLLQYSAIAIIFGCGTCDCLCRSAKYNPSVAKISFFSL